MRYFLSCRVPSEFKSKSENIIAKMIFYTRFSFHTSKTCELKILSTLIYILIAIVVNVTHFIITCLLAIERVFTIIGRLAGGLATA